MDNDGDIFIHSMKIVDPNSSFYGLSIHSTLLDIQAVFKKMSGFTVTIPQFKTGLRAIATYEERSTSSSLKTASQSRCQKSFPMSSSPTKTTKIIFGAKNENSFRGQNGCRSYFLGKLDLSGIEVVIGALLLQKFILGATFDDESMVKDHDFVTVTDGGKPVGDDHDGAVLLKLIKTLLDQHLRSRIDVACRLIENHDRWTVEACPSQA